MYYRKKIKKAAPGTWIDRDLFYSRAFLELSGFAPQLLILFLGKRKISKDKTVINKDNITMTYAELEKLYLKHESKGLASASDNLPKGISRPRIVRALDNLLAHGFIRIMKRGGAYQQDKSIYGLVEDWRLWRPGTVFLKREPDKRQRGYNGKLRKPHQVDLSAPSINHETVPFQKPRGRNIPPPILSNYPEENAQRLNQKSPRESNLANDTVPSLTNVSDEKSEIEEFVRKRIRTRLNLRKRMRGLG